MLTCGELRDILDGYPKDAKVTLDTMLAYDTLEPTDIHYIANTNTVIISNDR